MLSARILINWNNDGVTFIDESTRLLGWRTAIGVAPDSVPPFDRCASPGQAEIVLDNTDGRYSPANAGSVLFGLLRPGLDMILQISDGISTYSVFRGWLTAIRPEMGVNSTRRVTFAAEDAISRLAAARVALPILTRRRTDTLVSAAINLAFDAPYAIGWIAFNAVPANGDVIYIGSDFYRFRSAITAASGDVLIGATPAACAINLASAIEGAAGAGALYGLNTRRAEDMRAAFQPGSPPRVALTAALPGLIGTAVGLAVTGSALTLSGSTLTGGANIPAGRFVISSGDIVCDLTGDGWKRNRQRDSQHDSQYDSQHDRGVQTDSIQTSALDVIRQSVYTEFARFYADRNGDLTYHARSSEFQPAATALDLTGSPDDAPFAADSATDTQSIYARVQVVTYPRAIAGSLDVIARADSSLVIPPANGAAPGQRVVTFTFRDPNGAPCGGTDLQFPPAAFTDLLVNERRDGTGVDYTTDSNFQLPPPVINGTSITFTFLNYASGELYINRFQVRGHAVTTDFPTTQSRQDATSRARYGDRALSFDLPLTADSNYSASLAEYLLLRHATPIFAPRQITLTDVKTANGISPYAVALNSLISLGDPQTGLSGDLNGGRVRVTRIETGVNPPEQPSNGLFTIRFTGSPVDPAAYWVLDHPVNSVLGTTTRAAV